MKIASNKQKAARTKKMREPIYASIWLALFAELRGEFAAERSIG